MANKTIVEKAAEKVGYGLAMAEDVAGTVKTAIGSLAEGLKKSPAVQGATTTMKPTAENRPTSQAAAKKSPAKRAAAKKSPAKKAAAKRSAGARPAARKSGTAAKSVATRRRASHG